MPSWLPSCAQGSASLLVGLVVFLWPVALMAAAAVAAPHSMASSVLALPGRGDRILLRPAPGLPGRPARLQRRCPRWRLCDQVCGQDDLHRAYSSDGSVRSTITLEQMDEDPGRSSYRVNRTTSRDEFSRPDRPTSRAASRSVTLTSTIARLSSSSSSTPHGRRVLPATSQPSRRAAAPTRRTSRKTSDF
jgi:hypothetical protein